MTSELQMLVLAALLALAQGFPNSSPGDAG